MFGWACVSSITVIGLHPCFRRLYLDAGLLASCPPPIQVRPTLILPTSFKSYTLWNQQFAPKNRPFATQRNIWRSESPSIFRCYVGEKPSSHKLFWISLRIQEGYLLPITWRKTIPEFFPHLFWHQNHGEKRNPGRFFSETSGFDFSTTFSSRREVEERHIIYLRWKCLQISFMKQSSIKKTSQGPTPLWDVSFGPTASSLGTISMDRQPQVVTNWQQVAGLFHISRVHWLGNSSHQAVGDQWVGTVCDIWKKHGHFKLREP